MKPLPLFLATAATAAVVALFLAPTPCPAEDWMAGFKEGKAAFKSMSQLAFGPEGILFIADTKAAAVVAIATGDTKPAAADSNAMKVEGIDKKLASLLGTAADQILILDLAVNPLSHRAYLAVSRGRGPEAVPVLVRVESSGQLERVIVDAEPRDVLFVAPFQIA